MYAISALLLQEHLKPKKPALKGEHEIYVHCTCKMPNNCNVAQGSRKRKWPNQNMLFVVKYDICRHVLILYVEELFCYQLLQFVLISLRGISADITAWNNV